MAIAVVDAPDEVGESEEKQIGLLEASVDAHLMAGVFAVSIPSIHQKLFDCTLRSKYQGLGWWLKYRAAPIDGMQILFYKERQVGSPVSVADTWRTGSARPPMAAVNGQVVEPVQNGEVPVDGTVDEFVSGIRPERPQFAVDADLLAAEQARIGGQTVGATGALSDGEAPLVGTGVSRDSTKANHRRRG
jgi:hypothetical protein